MKTALTIGLGITALAGSMAGVLAQATTAGPATQPPAPPGTTQPAPTQPQVAAPAPPGTASGAPAAPAAAPATPPPNYNIQYNGLIDGYYLFQFNNPKGSAYITGRAYDIRQNSPALALAELNVLQNPKPNGLGFKATLMTGDVADINHGAFVGLDASGNTILVHNDGGEGRYKNVQQLYGTYALGGAGAGFDFGKFYTPFGYEVTEANGNYNYSRSVAYNYVPFYHAGARIYTPITAVPGLTATAYLVQAIFNTPDTGVQNPNKRPGYIGQLNYTDPKGKFVLVSELGLGKQKLSTETGPSTKIVLNDNNVTYNFNANMLAGVDYVYRKLTPDGGGKDTTNAYAVYYRQALTPKTAYALRFSGASDKVEDGLGGSFTARPYELTATYELKPAANFTTRLEFRHDNTNVIGSFVDKDGNLTKKQQDTLTLAGMFTF